MKNCSQNSSIKEEDQGFKAKLKQNSSRTGILFSLKKDGIRKY